MVIHTLKNKMCTAQQWCASLDKLLCTVDNSKSVSYLITTCGAIIAMYVAMCS